MWPIDIKSCARDTETSAMVAQPTPVASRKAQDVFRCLASSSGNLPTTSSTNRPLQRREKEFVHYQECLFRKQEKVAITS
jgi:hypothetical protein